MMMGRAVRQSFPNADPEKRPRIAVTLSLKQFRSQKWWERQQEVYAEMLEDLSAVFFIQHKSGG
jgi:hypothetical protein